MADSRDVAVVGLRDPQDRLLMIRTSRLPEYWQPIGGGMESHDRSPLDAVMRELREETRLVLESAKFTFVTEKPYDFGKGRVYFFQAEIDPTRDQLVFNEREILEHRWLPVDEAKGLKMYPATKAFVATLAGG